MARDDAVEDVLVRADRNHFSRVHAWKDGEKWRIPAEIVSRIMTRENVGRAYSTCAELFDDSGSQQLGALLRIATTVEELLRRHNALSSVDAALMEHRDWLCRRRQRSVALAEAATLEIGRLMKWIPEERLLWNAVPNVMTIRRNMRWGDYNEITWKRIYTGEDEVRELTKIKTKKRLLNLRGIGKKTLLKHGIVV